MKISEIEFPVRVWRDPGGREGPRLNNEVALKTRIRDTLKGRAPPTWGVKDSDDTLYAITVTDNFRIEVSEVAPPPDEERPPRWGTVEPPPVPNLNELAEQFIAGTDNPFANEEEG